MDARRFDALTRALGLVSSRRTLIGIAPKAASVGALALAVKPLATLADSTTSDVGGSTTSSTTTATTDGTGGTTDVGAVVCLPISQTGAGGDTLRPPFVADIFEGTCESLGDEGLYSLFDVDNSKGVTNVPPAAAMATSVTTVRSSLDDLLADRHSVVVRASTEDPTIVACGEIGGLLDGEELAVGIRERNGSGYSGVSYMKGTDGSTLVYLFLGLGLSTVEASAAAVGSSVVTTADVNMRADAAADSDVVTVVGEGTTLEVTGGATGEWVPVENPETGESGYISAQYLAVSD